MLSVNRAEPESQFKVQGLQNSASPFKGSSEKKKTLVNSSPVVLVKKKGSAKYS